MLSKRSNRLIRAWGYSKGIGAPEWKTLLVQSRGSRPSQPVRWPRGKLQCALYFLLWCTAPPPACRVQSKVQRARSHCTTHACGTALHISHTFFHIGCACGRGSRSNTAKSMHPREDYVCVCERTYKKGSCLQVRIEGQMHTDQGSSQFRLQVEKFRIAGSIHSARELRDCGKHWSRRCRKVSDSGLQSRRNCFI